MSESRSLRIAWIHPDLGIGGAERLVVDAACGLQNLGHIVEIFTSHWDPRRSFDETKDGTLKVTVLGNSLPISLRGRFHIVFAILRQLHLAVTLIYRVWFSSNFDAPDVYIVDQLSTCIPLLRWFTRTRVVFYCHFPDLLLSPGRGGYAGGVQGVSRANVLRKVYRLPLDALEEVTTSQADRILVNSNFTASMFHLVFPQIRRQLQIAYPGIKVSDFGKISDYSDTIASIERPTILSINRFEAKKNVALAIEAFAQALKTAAIPLDSRLVVAGGFDERVADCITTLTQLQELCKKRSLSYSTTSASRDVQVLFLTNMSTEQKTALLQSPNTRCLLYTPSHEHLGIVPLEAMACGLPVLAVNNGGPTETIVEGVTGMLRAASTAAWAEALAQLVNLPSDQRIAYRSNGQQRVTEHFDVSVLARSFERAVQDVVAEAEQGKSSDIFAETSFLKSLMFIVMSILCTISVIVLVRSARMDKSYLKTAKQD